MEYFLSRVQRIFLPLYPFLQRFGICWLQGSRIRFVLGCVIPRAGAVARSRNLEQALFGSPVWHAGDLPGHQVVHVSPLDDPRHQIVVVSLLHVEIIVFFEGYTYYYFVVQGDTAP